MLGFGSGEYRVPFLKLEEARYQLLGAVRRLCPTPLLQLRDGITPLYDQWVDEIVQDANSDREWERSPEGISEKEAMFEAFKRMGMPDEAAKKAAEGRPIEGLAPDDPIFFTFMLLQVKNPGLDRALKLWAQRNHLTHQRVLEEAVTPDVEEGEFVKLTLHEDYWACEWAMFTLWFWKFTPDGPAMKKSEPPEWITMPGDASRTSDEPAFRIQPGWDVLIEDEKTFRDRADAALNAYITRQRELAEARRLVPALDKRQPRHFDWLALYQVKGLEYRQIAEWENVQPGSQSVGDDAVRKGVQLAASLCGLIPREGKPGRPKTRK